MAEDPYSKWLGLKPGPRPPKPRDLLGVKKGADEKAIEAAADACMDRLDRFSLSGDRASRQQIQQLMNEVAKARTTLIQQSAKANTKAKESKQAPPPTTKVESKQTAKAKPAAEKRPERSEPKPADPSEEKIKASDTVSAAGPVSASAPAMALPPSAPRPYAQPRQRASFVFWLGLCGIWVLSLAATAGVVYVLASPRPAEPLGQTGIAPVVDQLETPTQSPEPQRLTGAATTDETLQQPATPTQPITTDIEPKPQAQEDGSWLDAFIAKRDQLAGQAQLELIQEKLNELHGGGVVQVSEAGSSTINVGKRPGSLHLNISIWRPIDPDDLQSKWTDLSVLKGLDIAWLNLSNCNGLTSLDGLQGARLERLTIRNCKRLTDISAIDGSALQSVELQNIPATDLSALNGMPLKNIQLSDMTIRSTDPLKSELLRSVDIESCDLPDIRFLAIRHDVHPSIRLYDTPLDNLGPLARKPILVLDIGNTKEQPVLRGLTDATIHMLRIRSDQLKDLSQLAPSNSINHLWIEGDGFSDLSQLAGFTIKALTLANKRIVSLRGLEDLPNLEVLNINGCPNVPESEVSRIRAQYVLDPIHIYAQEKE